MKIFLILIFSFISTYIVLSQNCAYKEYNKNIDLAQKECDLLNFKEANKIYKIAFESIDFPFGTDLRNAFKVAEKTKDEVWMEQIAIKLAKGGIPFKYFKFYNHFKWFKSFTKEFSQYQNYFNENFDHKFRKTLDSIAIIDFKTNNHFHEWRTKSKKHSIDSLVAEMTNVSLKFKKMIFKFGYPTEKKIGYYYNKGDINYLPTFVLFVHIYQRGELLFKENLIELICIGSLTNYQSNHLKNTFGLGNSTGIYQTMEACKKKYYKD